MTQKIPEFKENVNFTYKKQRIEDAETLQNIGETWFELHTLLVEYKHTHNIP